MWTTANRARYDHSRLRYPSDLTKDEWALIEPEIPPAMRGGNKRTVDPREIVNDLMSVLSTGRQWKAVPKDLPARSTLNDYLDLWNYDGTLDRIYHVLSVECHALAQREASPTAAIIDSRSVESAEKGRPVSTRTAMMRARRSKARSAVSGSTRKVFSCTPSFTRQIFRIAMMVSLSCRRSLRLHPFPLKLYADGGYQGPIFKKAVTRVCKTIDVQIVKQSEAAKGFTVLPRRWGVERTFAWLNRRRRLVKDWECQNGKARAFLRLASIRLIRRRLCQSSR